MRKVGFILLYIAVAMIGFGIGWNLGSHLKDSYMKEICNNATNLEWYIKNDCMKYYKNPWEK